MYIYYYFKAKSIWQWHSASDIIWLNSSSNSVDVLHFFWFLYFISSSSFHSLFCRPLHMTVRQKYFVKKGRPQWLICSITLPKFNLQNCNNFCVISHEQCWICHILSGRMSALPFFSPAPLLTSPHIHWHKDRKRLSYMDLIYAYITYCR